MCQLIHVYSSLSLAEAKNETIGLDVKQGSRWILLDLQEPLRRSQMLLGSHLQQLPMSKLKVCGPLQLEELWGPSAFEKRCPWVTTLGKPSSSKPLSNKG